MTEQTRNRSLFTVRPYRHEDVEGCAKCFFDGFFDCSRAAQDDVFLCEYVQVLVEKCDFTLVAERDGKIAGFICGLFGKEFRAAAGKYRVERHYGLWFRSFFKFLFGSYRLSPDFKEQLDRFIRFVHESKRGVPLKCDCELIALTSGKEYRTGVGTALLGGFLGVCRAENVKNVRLFTNTDAAYYFYEKRGFVRIWEKPYSFAENGASFVYEFVL